MRSGAVLVYDHRRTAIRGGDAYISWRTHVDRLAAAPADYELLVTALIETGVFESAWADALCPIEDASRPPLTALRVVSEALGLALASAWAGDRPCAVAAIDDAVRAASRVHVDTRDRWRVSVPEGYAFYALYPETYADAAAAWAECTGPARVACIGVRSIGTSLSGIVTGALRRRGIAVRSWTVRPRGHPFDRHVRLAPTLVSDLELPAADAILIVDEGPGFSGSSFAGTAAAISALGVPDDRITFLASWNPPPDRLFSPAAQSRWARHVVVTPECTTIRRALEDASVVTADAIEMSAGTWRTHLHVRPPWPAIHPQHERRKFLMSSGVARFAGLGAYGASTHERAQALGEAGWTPPPLVYRRGFLRQRVVRGRPMRRGDVSEAFLRHAAAYIAWLRRETSSGTAAAPTAIGRMLRHNTEEALGDGYSVATESLCHVAETFSEPAVAIDGRLMPHEWVMTEDGSAWTKLDALDHHHDHFFPGCTDAAWDVAGFLVEFSLGPEQARSFVAEYVRSSGDRSIARRLPFFTAAYTAFRCGYCSMAAHSLGGTPDGRRFDALTRRYRSMLAATLASNAA